MNITMMNMLRALLTRGNNIKQCYSFTIETLEAKILEAKEQLSQEALDCIYNDFDGDMFFGPMAYQSEIEDRWYTNESDEDDYDVLEYILDLLDMIMILEDTYDDFYGKMIDTLYESYPGINE